MKGFPEVQISLPTWVGQVCEPGTRFESDDERMGLAIRLAGENVKRGTGGPFGAAVFSTGGELIAPGVNLVATSNTALAHAEMVAIAVAGRAVGSFDLSASPTELVTSTEPCAMCLGAIPWSGVERLVCGARDEDARAIGFDEGDKPEDWTERLQARGIAVVTDLRRMEAAAVLASYARAGGVIYNGRSR
ncbi:MAG TPA: nucleoside deaminase [Acidimicrobiia bacterium]|jgi:tRNA(Arg) A34 adenosine deaminase TadA